MKRTILIFGLIAGAVLSAMMLATVPFMDTIGFDHGEVIGYSSMVVAFLLIFFGVRSYRDNVARGNLGFGKAFLVGTLIAGVASACYVATWQLVYYKLAPDFTEKYSAYVIAKERAAGATEQAIALKQAEMERFQALYRNPVINAAITLIEPLPVGLVVALVSAGVLTRRRRSQADDAVFVARARV